MDIEASICNRELWKYRERRNKKMEYQIGVIAGDGIGPEVVAEAKKVLDKIGEKFGHTFSYEAILMGGCSIDATGVPLTDEAIAAAKASDAVLMGSIGGNTQTSPWYKLAPNLRPEAGLLKLRKELNLFDRNQALQRSHKKPQGFM